MSLGHNYRSGTTIRDLWRVSGLVRLFHGHIIPIEKARSDRDYSSWRSFPYGSSLSWDQRRGRASLANKLFLLCLGGNVQMEEEEEEEDTGMCSWRRNFLPFIHIVLTSPSRVYATPYLCYHDLTKPGK